MPKHFNECLKTATQPGYMVLNPKGCLPTKVHGSFADAEKEAHRLMALLPGDKKQTIAVLKIDLVLTREESKPEPVIVQDFGFCQEHGVIATETVDQLLKPYPVPESHAPDAGVMIPGYGFHPAKQPTETKVSDIFKDIFGDNPVARVEPKLDTPAIPEGFIPWHGDKCPVAVGVEGEILFKNGIYNHGELHHWYWGQDAKNKIIAYRPFRSDDFQVKAGKWHITETGERLKLHIWPHAPWLYEISKKDKRVWSQDGDPANLYTKEKILCLAADQGGA